MSLSPLQKKSAYPFYYALLFRYARFILKDTNAAARLVTEVLQEHIETSPFQVSIQERRFLKEIVKLRCICWQQAQVFDRPVIKTETLFTHQNNNTK